MKKVLALWVTGLLVGVCIPAQANLIDFETLTDGQNINGLNLGGVTLYEPQLNIVRVYTNSRIGASYHSPVTSVSSDESSVGTYPIIGVFDSSQSHISLWAGDTGGDIDWWELEAFDATVGGSSLGLVQSAQWSGDPYTQLSIDASGIWRFEARYLGIAGAGVAYDDLEFSGVSVPVPGAILLAGMGTCLVSWLRRRRTL